MSANVKEEAAALELLNMISPEVNKINGEIIRDENTGKTHHINGARESIGNKLREKGAIDHNNNPITNNQQQHIPQVPPQPQIQSPQQQQLPPLPIVQPAPQQVRVSGGNIDINHLLYTKLEMIYSYEVKNNKVLQEIKSLLKSGDKSKG